MELSRLGRKIQTANQCLVGVSIDVTFNRCVVANWTMYTDICITNKLDGLTRVTITLCVCVLVETNINTHHILH